MRRVLFNIGPAFSFLAVLYFFVVFDIWSKFFHLYHLKKWGTYSLNVIIKCRTRFLDKVHITLFKTEPNINTTAIRYSSIFLQTKSNWTSEIYFISVNAGLIPHYLSRLPGYNWITKQQLIKLLFYVEKKNQFILDKVTKRLFTAII